MKLTVPVTHGGSSSRTSKPTKPPKTRHRGKRQSPFDPNPDIGPQLVPTEQDWLFINDYLQHGDAVHAYLAAGFNGTNTRSNAHVMLRKRVIQLYISNITKDRIRKAARVSIVTHEKIIGDLEEERLLAMEKEQCSAAIKATELQGKTIGLFQEDWKDNEQAPMISITYYNDNRQLTVGENSAPGALTPADSQLLIVDKVHPSPVVFHDREISIADLQEL